MRKTPGDWGERGVPAPLTQIAHVLLLLGVIYFRDVSTSWDPRTGEGCCDHYHNSLTLQERTVHLTTSRAICLTQIARKKPRVMGTINWQSACHERWKENKFRPVLGRSEVPDLWRLKIVSLSLWKVHVYQWCSFILLPWLLFMRKLTPSP